MSRQCGQCRRLDSAADLPATNVETQSVLMDQPFASSEMGDSMDADLLPELSGETSVASALLEELTADLPTAGSDIDLIAASCDVSTLGTVRSWLQSGSVPPWSACAGLSPSCTPIGGFAVSSPDSRTPRPDSAVSRLAVCRIFGSYTHCVPVTESSLLVGHMWRCSNLHSFLHGLLDTQITKPTKSPHGSRRGRT